MENEERRISDNTVRTLWRHSSLSTKNRSSKPIKYAVPFTRPRPFLKLIAAETLLSLPR